MLKVMTTQQLKLDRAADERRLKEMEAAQLRRSVCHCQQSVSLFVCLFDCLSVCLSVCQCPSPCQYQKITSLFFSVSVSKNSFVLLLLTHNYPLVTLLCHVRMCTCVLFLFLIMCRFMYLMCLFSFIS